MRKTTRVSDSERASLTPYLKMLLYYICVLAVLMSGLLSDEVPSSQPSVQPSTKPTTQPSVQPTSGINLFTLWILWILFFCVSPFDFSAMFSCSLLYSSSAPSFHSNLLPALLRMVYIEALHYIRHLGHLHHISHLRAWRIGRCGKESGERGSNRKFLQQKIQQSVIVTYDSSTYNCFFNSM